MYKLKTAIQISSFLGLLSFPAYSNENIDCLKLESNLLKVETENKELFLKACAAEWRQSPTIAKQLSGQLKLEDALRNVNVVVSAKSKSLLVSIYSLDVRRELLKEYFISGATTGLENITDFDFDVTKNEITTLDNVYGVLLTLALDKPGSNAAIRFQRLEELKGASALSVLTETNQIVVANSTNSKILVFPLDASTLSNESDKKPRSIGNLSINELKKPNKIVKQKMPNGETRIGIFDEESHKLHILETKIETRGFRRIASLDSDEKDINSVIGK